MTKVIEKLSNIADNFDVFIVDLWGVIYDGDVLFEEAIDCLSRLKDKRIVFLSNTPGRAHATLMKLFRCGLPENITSTILTSGELLNILARDKQLHRLISIKAGKYFYFGGDEHIGLLEDTHYKRTSEIYDCDFILATGLPLVDKCAFDYHDILMEAVNKDRKMLCVNPDIYIAKKNGDTYYCAGHVAEYYQSLGGKVFYVGKPHTLIYEYLFDMLGNPAKDNCLAIGDGLNTDILGAYKYGITSLMIDNDAFDQDFSQLNFQPEYSLSKLIW